MSIKNVLEQFIGSNTNSGSQSSSASNGGQLLKQFTQGQQNSNSNKSFGVGSKGLLGGLAAGGILGLLVSNKSARKVAGKAAKYGGAALLGGAAYKIYQNWQQNTMTTESASGALTGTLGNTESKPQHSNNYQLTVLKAMIASSKADGHIDAEEQKKIFEAVAKMELPPEVKGIVFDFMSNPISIQEIVDGVSTMEEKTEIYFASCLVGDMTHPAERIHLNELANALGLPNPLVENIEVEANQTMQLANSHS